MNAVMRQDLALAIFLADNSNAEYPEQQFYQSHYSEREYAYRIADALLKDGWRK